jgi:hypothetical protein
MRDRLTHDETAHESLAETLPRPAQNPTDRVDVGA